MGQQKDRVVAEVMARGKLLHMNAGNGECSYARSSTLQRKVILKAKPVLEDAIRKMFNSGEFPKCFNMADLGCSSGPNTLFTVSNIMKIVQRLCHEKSCKMPEFQAYLNDLPDNDFNTVFKSIPSFYQNLKDGANCFVSGMPGSFYERLFPTKTLQLVHSSYSLHWLSQSPEKIENNNSIYITRTSPPQVFEAYKKQFEKDFSRFLQLRSEEIVTGGHMLITFIGRSIPDPHGYHCAHLDLLSESLIDLVHEGLIEQAELDSFNYPFYSPYKDELKKIVEMEGSFDLDNLEIFQVNWDERDDDDDICFDAYSSGKHVAKTMRAVLEQMLVSHFQFGDSIVDYLFERYAYHLACHLLVQKGKFCNIVISLRKK
ncbi:probable jasmonic acid carboxyl methyltransferase 2 [Lycium ferocissimum]|uniref:probable jasmonic acid carboxyl methyltransferase 2 n=1 Tax=Lycium ferocissimum TaxID=112874 RepID=UPI002814A1CA|nr:probable jasmonic acid carboxyl methyltransferase 2 [Lycium ferocissimum]